MNPEKDIPLLRQFRNGGETKAEILPRLIGGHNPDQERIIWDGEPPSFNRSRADPLPKAMPCGVLVAGHEYRSINAVRQVFGLQFFGSKRPAQDVRCPFAVSEHAIIR